ncbi:hypothetical protein HXX76_007250 [Chlamydomonas incerta]|uniref:Uncharacterized protein n=1 Tax=Chlamydomonas incerta TaxID=51695 RepID=A0A835T0P4_CHLIN|nr:hypothetical protein HXX76_007250 [Chlamydomonas incerta]|eukprot:KAG2435166.1 hypothetical protein HXX76_007250 [Chlamydomonas incerta]
MEMLQEAEKQHNFLARIARAQLKYALRPPSPDGESLDSGAGFEGRVTEYYGIRSAELKCMVLGKALPRRFLVADRLYAERWKRYADLTMGADFRFDSPRNGVLWNSAIAYEYEEQRICFSYSGLGAEFILHVLDRSLLWVKLSAVGQHRNDPDFVTALGDVTFGDLHNGRVDFASVDGAGPFKGTLALHARIALKHCAKIYPDGFDPQAYDFGQVTEEKDKEEFVRMLLEKLDIGGAEEGGLSEEADSFSDAEESVDGEEAGFGCDAAVLRYLHGRQLLDLQLGAVAVGGSVEAMEWAIEAWAAQGPNEDEVAANPLVAALQNDNLAVASYLLQSGGALGLKLPPIGQVVLNNRLSARRASGCGSCCRRGL